MGKWYLRDYKRDKLIRKLYKSGSTYKEIGETLKLSKIRVGQLYRRMLREEDKKAIKH